jgi:hypothetical protein
LTIAQAGTSKSRTIALALSRSSRLLNESCLPWCWRTIDMSDERAPTCW